MNDIKRRIDEIEAGGVDEQKKLLEHSSHSLRQESFAATMDPTTDLPLPASATLTPCDRSPP
jgi:hypothetical protein